MNEYFVLRIDKKRQKEKRKEKKCEEREWRRRIIIIIIILKVILHCCFLFGDHCKSVRIMEIVGNLIEAGESVKEIAKRIIVRDRSSRPILCFIYFAAIVCSGRIY